MNSTSLLINLTYWVVLSGCKRDVSGLNWSGLACGMFISDAYQSNLNLYNEPRLLLLLNGGNQIYTKVHMHADPISEQNE